MAELPPLAYGRVVGRFLANVADGPDLADLPEFPPLTGRVTFAAEAPKILVANAVPDPATYVQLPKHYECQLDEFGYLTWRGGRGIRLVAADANTNPSEWTWRVSFDLSYDGDRVPIDPFSFTVPEYIPGPDPEDPDSGSTGLVDLTLVSPVPASPGNAVVRGERGEGIQVDRRVATYGDLPATPPEGDGAQYVVAADGLLYVYRTGDGWMADGDGVVIRGPAGTTDWGGITGKPAVFPPDVHTHVATEISDSTTVGRSVLTAVDAPAARTALGAVGTSRQIATGAGLTGGGDLGADRTLAVAFGTSSSTACVGDDSRLSDARPPTSAGQVYDIAFVAQIGQRATGAGNVVPQGIKLRRNIRITEVTYRGATADASGNTAIELRRNGSQISGTEKTIAAADQTAGGANATATGTWDLDAGDVLLPYVTAVGTTPGNNLIADIKAVTR
ncbi:hypothetical protein IU433_12150 [Nocardia puris]|uniref:hypothetical protein n=1 Tax=Nocardia puris TaxID=208602 RepID=UPI0018941F0A|nr:hypothetical protein [Nocardia puris]MBF6459788.1 hypothetical protein [Nocardia puris]